MTAFAAAASGPRPGAGQSAWREVLAPYARPRLGRSLLDIATSVVPYLALWVLMYLSLDVSYLLVLALAVPTAGFLVRVFVMFHDCAHGSLLPSKRANAWLGAVLGCLSSRRFCAGSTITPSITPPRGIWIGGAPATYAR